MDRRLRTLRIHVWIGRHEYPRAGAAFARRQAVHAERREDVDLQRGLCRPFHRLRENRWRAVFRVSGRARHARADDRGGRAQARHSRLLDLPAGSLRLRDPGRKPAWRSRQRPSHRLQHSERRPLQIRRGDFGRSPSHAPQCSALRQAAHRIRQTHHVVRADPGKDR